MTHIPGDDDDVDIDSLLSEIDSVVEKPKKAAGTKPTAPRTVTSTAAPKAAEPKKSVAAPAKAEGKAAGAAATAAAKARTIKSKGAGDDDDDLDTLLSDDIDIASAGATKVTLKPVASVGLSKCFPVYLAGSEDEAKACKSMRCLSCDHLVLRIVDSRWHERADYMFFRNFHPNIQKLQANIVAAPGYAAYCCQCSWKSVKEITTVSQTGEGPRWSCAKHA